LNSGDQTKRHGLAFGDQLRAWRKRRRLTQMELSFRANVSTRHLGFVEIGRAAPSRSLVLRLSEVLELPLRERNALMKAAGFAPIFSTASFDDDAFAAVRTAIAATLEAHKPFPAFAIDRLWNIVASNAAIPELYEGIAPELLAPPVNVFRLHPRGLAPRIVNLAEWAAHLLHRLKREAELTAAPALASLLDETSSYDLPALGHVHPGHEIALPLRVMTRLGELSFISTVSVFGTPADVTLSEIALEMLYPANQETRERVLASGSISGVILT
jgi:transcriptional regulator with XRE-family HTH domain